MGIATAGAAIAAATGEVAATEGQCVVFNLLGEVIPRAVTTGLRYVTDVALLVATEGTGCMLI